MSEIEQVLQSWESSLCKNISLAALHARNPTAHKWKAPYRSLVLRECVFWRTHDLLRQAQALFQQGHVLGSRILIRSALESVAALIYLNQLTARVLDGSLDFHRFSEKTSTLLLGSRDGSTKHTSINIASVLQQCEKRYEGLSSVYATLSESAHPNYEGVCFGYARVDFAKDEEVFSNNWIAMWADRHDSLMKLVFMVFETEYNEVWPPQLEALERWLATNDAHLEATKEERT
jgi:hypothetical protein